MAPEVTVNSNLYNQPQSLPLTATYMDFRSTYTLLDVIINDERKEDDFVPDYIISYFKRMVSLLFGLFLYALGLVFSIQANVGLAPWDAFTIGVSGITGSTYGQISILTGIVIIFIAVLLKEKLGVGTILNTFLIGIFADIILASGMIPQLHVFWLGVLMLLLGQVVISVASYFYIRPGLGAGPRDSLMIALGKRLPKVPIGLIRGCIEATVLLIGFLLGAKVGLGTVIAVFGIGTILQTTFSLLHFDVKAVRHESIFETVRALQRKMGAAPEPDPDRKPEAAAADECE